jgi:DNA repair photolyase
MLKCAGCNNPSCESAQFCSPWRDKGALEEYGGSAVRFTADGFDCALPISIDTYNICSFRCLYCFANYLIRDPQRKGAFKVRALKAKDLTAFLENRGSVARSILDVVGKDGTPQCAVQWGALGDPFDYIERQVGRSYELMDVFEKYDQAVRISTKGADVLLDKRYLAKFARRPDLWWIAFSMISIDDAVLERIDKDAPNATQRLKAMKALSDLGIKTSLRLRPIFPGVTDCTPAHPTAWRELLDRAADAGAKAVSMEFTFVPGARPAHVEAMWREINDIVGFDIVKWYDRTSVYGACLRSSRAWKQDLTLAIYEHAKKLGLWFGISDPHFKELNDFGCCCGIPDDERAGRFAGWQRANATCAIVKARDEHCTVSAVDGTPVWADKVKMRDLVCMSGAQNAMRRATLTWGDKLRGTWNDLRGNRGALHYFDGVLQPKAVIGADVIYGFVAPVLKKNLKPPVWAIGNMPERAAAVAGGASTVNTVEEFRQQVLHDCGLKKQSSKKMIATRQIATKTTHARGV